MTSKKFNLDGNSLPHHQKEMKGIKNIFGTMLAVFGNKCVCLTSKKTLKHEQYFSNAQHRLSWIKPPR